MAPDIAERYYDTFCHRLLSLGVKSVEKGIFGADMKVSLVNDGLTEVSSSDSAEKSDTRCNFSPFEACL